LNYLFLCLVCLSLSLDLLRSSFLFQEGKYPAGYRLREAMWRTVAMWVGGITGWLIGFITPGNFLLLDFSILMFVGVKMIWQGATTLPADTSFRLSAGTQLMFVSSVNSFLSGIALGISGQSFWAAAVVLGLMSVVMQTVSRKLAKGRLPLSNRFRPVVFGGVVLVIVSIIHYIFI